MKLSEVQNDVQVIPANMRENLHINDKNSKNDKKSKNNPDFLNDEPQQQVPAFETATLKNESATKEEKEEKLAVNKNGDHLESSPSKLVLQTSGSAIRDKPATSSKYEKIATSAKLQSMTESSSKHIARLNEWEGKKFTITCLEGHNDVISSVDMDGTVLISGRFVY